jgi:outer membrane protein TolC
MRSRRITAADAAWRAKVSDLQSAEQKIELSVKRQFVELAYFEKDLELLEKQREICKDVLDNVNDKMKHGQATVKDLASASRRYLSIMSDLVSRERKYRDTRRELAQFVDIPLSVIDINNMTNNLSVPEPIMMDDDDVQEIALERRPDLIALAWQVAAAESSLKEESARKIPWFQFFQVSYGAGNNTARNESFIINNDGTRDYGTRDDGSSTEWRIDTAINIPIFAWVNNTCDLRKKEYERVKVIRDRSICDAKDNIADAISVLRENEENYNKIADCVKTIDKSMSDLLPASDNNAVMLSLDMANVRNHILDAARLELSARFDYINAVIDLNECIYVGNK